jgi:hypothetical protein
LTELSGVGDLVGNGEQFGGVAVQLAVQLDRGCTR